MSLDAPFARVRFAFRADASVDIGNGHLMRCLTLADALRARGAECHFICRELSGHLLDLIARRGFLGYRLATGTDGSAVVGWTQDARQSAAILSEVRPEWLIADHYGLDHKWETELRPYYRKLLVIDDLVRTHSCDVLLDQTFRRSPETYRACVPAGCTVLTGSEYALLRPEFAALRRRSLERRVGAPWRTVLVSVGGVDQSNVTSSVLEGLRAAPLPAECVLKVVLGQHAPGLGEVQHRAREMPWLTQVLVDVTDMASLMAEADFAIGAAGTTSWERCCLGLPSFVVVIADNQRDVAAALQSSGAAYVITEMTQLAPVLQQAIAEQTCSVESVLRMSRAASEVTDGKGVTRVLEHLNAGSTGSTR